MKKTRLYFLGLVLFSLTLSSCLKKVSDGLSCSTLATNASNAALAFSTNPNEANCREYAKAIQDYYDGCDLIPAATKQSYDDTLASLDCDSYNQ